MAGCISALVGTDLRFGPGICRIALRSAVAHRRERRGARRLRLDRVRAGQPAGAASRDRGRLGAGAVPAVLGSTVSRSGDRRGGGDRSRRAHRAAPTPQLRAPAGSVGRARCRRRSGRGGGRTRGRGLPGSPTRTGRLQHPPRRARRDGRRRRRRSVTIPLAGLARTHVRVRRAVRSPRAAITVRPRRLAEQVGGRRCGRTGSRRRGRGRRRARCGRPRRPHDLGRSHRSRCSRRARGATRRSRRRGHRTEQRTDRGGRITLAPRAVPVETRRCDRTGRPNGTPGRHARARVVGRSGDAR